MELTREAKKELEELTTKMESSHAKMHEMNQMGLRHEARDWERKYYRIDEKINEIKSLGVSSKEKTAVIRALPSMTSIHGTRDIAGTSKEVTGFVKQLNSYVVVSYTKYSSIMSNVRGCSGLAGKVDLRSIRLISKATHDEIVSGVRGTGGYKQEVNFMGMSQKTVGGVVIK